MTTNDIIDGLRALMAEALAAQAAEDDERIARHQAEIAALQATHAAEDAAIFAARTGRRDETLAAAIAVLGGAG